ncbi:sporulation integral membrane protein YtvI [Tumebacillus algifaecis]|uniref:Sporulation integral membrane protein YtvI n=1 Tax=Tumebacillus algifaecis TaxID=1214604 RepID=A0A223D3Q9_9BACL|nr:sporulation integral membrane protein YtvI [Tumebacillus algifaecis]ASS76180.1 sporulation integral membrane protein YtvI [Tumebacillus algifaecis]
MLSFVLKHRYSLINLGLWVLFGWLVWAALRFALPFFLPLLFGLLIAVLIEPVVKLLLKTKMPRWVSSFASLLLLFGGGAAVLILLAAKLTIELAQFSERVPSMASGLVSKGSDLLHSAVAFYTTLSPEMSEKVRENLSQLGSVLANIGKGASENVLHWLGQVPSAVTIFLLSLLIAYFLSKDFPLWQRRLFRLIHPSIREKGDQVLEDLGKATFGYVRAQAILIGITFCQVLIGLLILGVDYAFSLSLLAAFLDILPLLGTGALFVPWAIYMFMTGNVQLGIGLLIVYGLIVAVRQLLEPRILAQSIGLDPLVTLVMMYAGYQALGFVGVLLAPFLIITFTSLLKVRAFDFLIEDKISDKNQNE